jgi:uncharacterized protein
VRNIRNSVYGGKPGPQKGYAGPMEPNDSAENKTDRLIRLLEAYPSVIVAFSGGVDSCFLLHVAHEVLGDNAVAATIRSPLHPAREIRFARDFARRYHIRHIVVESDRIEPEALAANSMDRCYVCKTHTLTALRRLGAEIGIAQIVDGANLDDLGDYRPGMKAAREMGVASPLMTAGFTKADIRRMSRQRNLSSWNKPSMACLASRIPFGTPITREALRQVEEAESLLLELGFAACRVRHHGRIARIELPADQIDRFLSKDVRTRVVQDLRALGFRFVALDLEGYRQGSMNPAIDD